MSRIKVGAICWVLCLQYFVAEALAAAGWGGSYSFSRNYISDLGAVTCDAAAGVCSPLHALMNASFVLQSALIVAGALLVRAAFPAARLSRTGLTLAGAAGLGVFVVGLAPEDFAPGPHYAGAVENFLFCNVGMILLGLALMRSRDARTVGLVSLAAGAIGLVGLGCLAVKSYFGLGVGVIGARNRLSLHLLARRHGMLAAGGNAERFADRILIAAKTRRPASVRLTTHTPRET